MEEAADGEEFGIEDGGTGCATDEIVREKSELDVEERTFADAADTSGHATMPPVPRAIQLSVWTLVLWSLIGVPPSFAAPPRKPAFAETACYGVAGMINRAGIFDA